jgi:putative ABC transport system permease protein
MGRDLNQASSPPAGRRRNDVLADLWPDVRHGLRQLWRSPGFTAVALITLALGIGANTAIFSVADTVLMRPFPYEDPNRLAIVWGQNPSRDWTTNIVSPANVLDPVAALRHE